MSCILKYMQILMDTFQSIYIFNFGECAIWRNTYQSYVFSSIICLRFISLLSHI